MTIAQANFWWVVCILISFYVSPFQPMSWERQQQTDRKKEKESLDLAQSQVLGSLEEVWLTHWEHWFPRESGIAPGLTCTGTSLIAQGLWFGESQDVWNSGGNGAASTKFHFEVCLSGSSGQWESKTPCHSSTSPTCRCLLCHTEHSRF